MGLADSETVLTDLRDSIESSPKAKRELEAKLTEIANGEPLTTSRARVTSFKGVIHRGGGITLNVACDNHFSSRHRTIDPITLRDVRNKMDKDMGLDTDLAAFTGERPNELYNHRITQFRKLNDNYYALDSIKFQNKGGLEHFTILPARIAEAAIKRAQDNGWGRIRPNWIDAWRRIRASALAGFGVHLTAKYLRQRYKTIAHDAGMPANHFNFLEGTNPTEGENARFYEQEDEAKLLREYDLLLSENLDLTHIGEPKASKPRLSDLLTGTEVEQILSDLQAIKSKLGIPT